MNEIEKTQAIRVWDFLAIGPIMIWFGISSKNMPEIAKIFMIGAGLGTIFYNYQNYLRAKSEP
jgi:hypothetical protein